LYIQVILTGEGADEVFAGYSYLLLDYLRAPDPASVNLGFPLPSDMERLGILKFAESIPPPQDHISISDMSFSDVPEARAMLGGISTHRVFATTGAPASIFPAEALEKYGTPNHAKTVAEGFSPQVREKAISGQWHPLQVAQVRLFLVIDPLGGDYMIDTGSEQYTIASTMLSNGILNYVGERAEMANSVESRPPFLDHKLSEYANTLPPYVNPRLGYNAYMQ
jgi:asparagine synthase (glutamine-hydrolysing)